MSAYPRRSDREGRRSSSRARWVWPLVILLAVVAGEVNEPLLPASHLLTPLLLGFVAALTGLVTAQVPQRVNHTCHAVLGVMFGGSLSGVALRHLAGAILPLATAIVTTVVFSLVAAAVLTLVGRVDRATATLGMIAGGSAAAVSCAEDLKADARLVAIMQYLRVVLVAATAPVLVGMLLSSREPLGHAERLGPPAWQLVSGPHQGAGVLLVAAVAAGGAWIGRRARLPSAALLGPMLLAAALTASGVVPGFAPTGALRSVLFTVVGLDVGLRFTRSSVSRMGRLLPLALACVAAVSLACAAVAWLLSRLTHIPLPDAYLATTPGGINAVLATAAASHADLSLISSVQSLRLFAMVLMAPLIVRVLGWSLDRRAVRLGAGSPGPPRPGG